MHDREEDRQLPFFVYGTLRRGFANHQLMWEAEPDMFAVAARLNGYGLFDAGIPFVRELPGGEVAGELYRFAPQTYPEALRRLDGLEGYHEHSPSTSLYVRTALPVRTAAGQQLAAWVYVGGRRFRADQRTVASGDWSARHAA